MANSGSQHNNNNIHRDFYIPTYILAPDAPSRSGHIHLPDDVPICPVLVFINSKSGGQLGGELLRTYRHLLNKYQVFDLGEEAPDSVLRRLYLNVEKLKSNGDQFASKIEERMRLIVAGGDGTAGWLLGVVSDLKLSQPPAIATVPLGTGNNLPFAFGWGKKNPGTDLNSVISFLKQVMNAKEMKMDSWHILMRMKAPKHGSCDPIAPLELPHSLHAFHRVSPSDELNVEGCHTFRGGFWNYFSMGMDAQVSYAFHSERKMNPEKFKNQLVNQSAYLKLGCTQGWFYAPLAHHSSRNIAQLAKVKIMKKHGEWHDLQIPHSVRSIVCLNLPSFSGGLNPWGTPNSNKRRYVCILIKLLTGYDPFCCFLTCVYGLIFSHLCPGLLLFFPFGGWGKSVSCRSYSFVVIMTCIYFFIGQRDLTPPFVDDGLLEVVGFRDAWHGLVLLAPKGHGTRLAQAHRIRFEFHKGTADHTFMRIDGEPWKQPLPEDDDTVVVEISHLGQVKMLAINDCRAKSIHDSSSHFNHDADDVDSDEENSVEEERRKFGAADTFKIPDEVDISRLS